MSDLCEGPSDERQECTDRAAIYSHSSQCCSSSSPAETEESSLSQTSTLCSGSSSQSFSLHSHYISKLLKRRMAKHIKQNKFKSLVAVKERKRIGKLSAGRYYSETKSAQFERRWRRVKAQIDRELEPEMRAMLKSTERLRQQNRELILAGRQALKKSLLLERDYEELREWVDSRHLNEGDRQPDEDL